MNEPTPTLDRQQVLTVLNLYLDWPRSCDALGDSRTNGGDSFSVIMDYRIVQYEIRNHIVPVWERAK